MYVVTQGNPADGFTLHGPFETVDDGADWADCNLDEWWILEIEPVIQVNG